MIGIQHINPLHPDGVFTSTNYLLRIAFATWSNFRHFFKGTLLFSRKPELVLVKDIPFRPAHRHFKIDACP